MAFREAGLLGMRGSLGDEDRPGRPSQGSEADDGELLDAYSRAVVRVVEQVGPAVISIGVRKGRGRRGSGGEAAGSGVVITPDGYVLTNQHVVADAESIEARLIDGNTYSADLFGWPPVACPPPRSAPRIHCAWASWPLRLGIPSASRTRSPPE
jgi:S1-C subfamily serine protease